MTFAAQHSVAYCDPSLRAATGSSEPAQPPSNASGPPLSVSITAPGRPINAVVVSSVAAAAAIAIATTALALVLLLRGRRRRSVDGDSGKSGLQVLLRIASISDLRSTFAAAACKSMAVFCMGCCHDGMLYEVHLPCLFDRERASAES